MSSNTINSLASFLDAELKTNRSDSSSVVFRGHGNEDFRIIPKLYRDDKSKSYERKLLSDLVSDVPDDFLNDNTTLDQLVRAQHYGLPTRLLDVSFNPLVALYFACSGIEHQNKDGQLIRFNVSPERVKGFDSDAISCAANLSKLSNSDRDRIFEYFKQKRKDGNINTIDFRNFNRILEAKKLVDFVRMEKPYFKNEIKPMDIHQFFLILPKMNSVRVIAQSGAFFISGLVYEIDEGSTKSIDIRRYKIPKEQKRNILHDLELLNISNRSLFPGIESSAQFVSKKYSSNHPSSTR